MDRPVTDNPLDDYTDADLVEELFKRCDNGIIIMHKADRPGSAGTHTWVNGNTLECIALLGLTHHELCAGAGAGRENQPEAEG